MPHALSKKSRRILNFALTKFARVPKFIRLLLCICKFMIFFFVSSVFFLCFRFFLLFNCSPVSIFIFACHLCMVNQDLIDLMRIFICTWWYQFTNSRNLSLSLSLAGAFLLLAIGFLAITTAVLVKVFQPYDLIFRWVSPINRKLKHFNCRP